MFRKKFFVYCAVAAGIATLLSIPLSYKEIPINDQVDMWIQFLFEPLFFGFGALALFGIVKESGSHLIFRILAVIMLVFAFSTIPIPVPNPPYGLVVRPVFSFLFDNEDQISGFFMAAFSLLTMIIAIAAFIQKKWIPGVCLVAINLPLLIPNIVYLIYENSPLLEYTWNSDWYPAFMVGIFLLAWFTIAWWFNNENSDASDKEIFGEGVKRIRKNFFVFCAIAAGLVVLFFGFSMSNSEYFINSKVDVWAQYFYIPFMIGSGALALYGVAKIAGSHLIFRILALLVLVAAVSLLPIPYNDPGRGWVPRHAFKFLDADEDSTLGYYLMAYYLLIGITGIAALVKKKWLPGGCLAAFILQAFFPSILHWLSIDIPLLIDVVWYSDWYSYFVLIEFAVVWLLIAWWFYRENKTTLFTEQVEARSVLS